MAKVTSSSTLLCPSPTVDGPFLTKLWVGVVIQQSSLIEEAPESSVAFIFFKNDKILSSSPYFIPVGRSIAITVRGDLMSSSTAHSEAPQGASTDAVIRVLLDYPSIVFKEVHLGGPSFSVRGLPVISGAYLTKTSGSALGGDRANISIPNWSMFLLDPTRIPFECIFGDISSGFAVACDSSTHFCLSCVAPPSLSSSNALLISIRLETSGILFSTNLNWTFVTSSCEIVSVFPEAILVNQLSTITVSGSNFVDGMICNFRNTSVDSKYVSSKLVTCVLFAQSATSDDELTVSLATFTCKRRLRIIASDARILAVIPSVVSFNPHAAVEVTVIGSRFFSGINMVFGRFFECRSLISSQSHVVCDVTFPSVGKHVVSSPLAFASLSVFVVDVANTRLTPSRGLSVGGTTVTLSPVRGLPNEDRIYLFLSGKEESSACQRIAESLSITCILPPSSQDCCSKTRVASFKIGTDVIESPLWIFQYLHPKAYTSIQPSTVQIEGGVLITLTSLSPIEFSPICNFSFSSVPAVIMSAFSLGCLAPSFERTGIHSLDLLLDGLSILDSAFAVQVVQSRNVTVSPTLVPIRGGVMLTVTSILDTFPINCECNFGAILTTAKKLSDTAALCPIPTPRSGSNVTKMVYLLTKFSCITFYVDFSPAAMIQTFPDFIINSISPSFGFFGKSQTVAVHFTGYVNLSSSLILLGSSNFVASSCVTQDEYFLDVSTLTCQFVRISVPPGAILNLSIIYRGVSISNSVAFQVVEATDIERIFPVAIEKFGVKAVTVTGHNFRWNGEFVCLSSYYSSNSISSLSYACVRASPSMLICDLRFSEAGEYDLQFVDSNVPLPQPASHHRLLSL